MKPPGASSSAPVQIVGPDSSERYVGLILSTEKISKSIGTSDTTGETREFLEIQLKVQSHTTLQFPDVPDGDPDSLKRKPGDPPHTRKFNEVVNVVSPDKIVRFYFKPEEKLRVGDLLEVTTRSRRSISYGWVSGEHGATYRILEKKAK
jgi:hypothetical protein